MKSFVCNAAENEEAKDERILIVASNNDICRIYMHEIIYIANEDRKSVLYLADRKIETNYRFDYWKSVLDPETFARPHYSFIVNFDYVYEITKEWVKLRCGDKTYSVYTSTRKIREFRKAFLDFCKR